MAKEAQVKRAVHARLGYAPRVILHAPAANLNAKIKQAMWAEDIRRFSRMPSGLLLWRMNTGQAMLPGRGGQAMPVVFGVPGTSDYIGVAKPGGRFVGIEIKSDERKASGQYKSTQSDAQIVFETALTLAGGFYALVRSGDDVDRALAALFAEEVTQWRETGT